MLYNNPKPDMTHFMFSRTTHSIKVTVTPAYLDSHSAPEDGQYVWAYTVNLENQSEVPVQLLNRYWHITDSNGLAQEVRGPGVVGEQPVLKPGEAFQYTSGTTLKTPSGIMVGSYQMARQTGEMIEVAIPAFSLDSPYQVTRPN